MSIEALAIILALAVISILWIVAPLFRGSASDNANAPIQKQYDELLIAYERILSNLRDLDEDYAMGKVQAADYEPTRAALMERGIQTLMALDELMPDIQRAEQQIEDEAIDRAIETAVSARRGKISAVNH